MAEAILQFLVPEGIDDDLRVSGGNVYDRRLADALRARGIDVRAVPVAVNRVTDAARAMSALPHDALVLVDGLLAVAASDVLQAHASRLRIVVLAHMVASALPGSSAPDRVRTAERERVALQAPRRVIATSEWTRAELVARRLAESDRIAVALPGTGPAMAASGSGSGGRLLCVGAVAPHKGQDVLVNALAGMTDLLGWRCTIAGSLDADPEFADRVGAMVRAAGIGDRVDLAGVLTGRELEDAYRHADLVVAPSRSESYGMAIADALARGIPVVAARVGGVPEAIAGSRGGILVRPDDPVAMRAVLRRSQADRGWSAVLKAEAMRSRSVFATRTWDAAAAVVAATLGEVRSTARPAEYDRRRTA
jgi:glycosyltransferase involved in cell wall biosynthesis